jgi:hypothetical protein
VTASQPVSTTARVPTTNRPVTRAASERSPAEVYLARLAPGSRRTMAGALERLAGLFSQGTQSAAEFPWHQLRYEHAQASRLSVSSRSRITAISSSWCSLQVAVWVNPAGSL